MEIEQIMLSEMARSDRNIEEEILCSLAVGRIDRTEDIPSDEDCEGIFEIEVE